MARDNKPFKKPKKLKDIIQNGKLQGVLEEIQKQGEDALDNIPLTPDIESNHLKMQEIFKDCFDIVLRRFSIGEEQRKGIVVYIDGITKKEDINNNILMPLMTNARLTSLAKPVSGETLLDTLKNTSLASAEVKEAKNLKDVVKGVLAANTALFIDKCSYPLLIGTANWAGRSVSEPITESVVVGPHEAFVENVKTNINLIRKRLKTPDLKMESIEIGRLGKNSTIITYIKGIANEKIINEVRQRLNRIDLDIAFEPGYIRQLIEDDPLSVFPLSNLTERPDSTVAALSEGRIAIFSDGSGYAIILPVVFADLLSSPEDYYERFYFATFVRLLRYTAWILSILGPSLYIALTTFHQEMIPKNLLFTISAARAQVPFPAIIEAFIMEISFEILREAGVRLPKPVGQAVSIVGALIIGQAAVEAGFVSQAMVIVVAITGIASFTIPKFSTAVSGRLLRFLMMILASVFGLYGIIMGGLFLLLHMASLRSVGVPYLTPLAPLKFSDWKDFLFRAPAWMMKKRPSFTDSKNQTKVEDNLKPQPPNS